MHLLNPATEESLGEAPEQTGAEVNELLSRAEAGFRSWKKTPMDRRSALLRRAGALFGERATELAALMAREMGKPLAAGEAEARKCADCCAFFADRGAEFLAPESVPSDAARSGVRYDPLGPVLAIMPWNFPFWQVVRFAAPALMAGNVGLLKHAPNVPGCARALESLFRDAGFPEGVWTTLFVSNEAAEALIAHPLVRAVTLTGSTRAGVAVATAAARVLKKSVLELGGSDPFIVLADDVPGDDSTAFLDTVLASAVSARTINSGQSCIAAKRFIMAGGGETFRQRFAEGMAARMAALVVGDPSDRATQLGPLARLDLLEHLHDQVQRSVEAGARLLTGGRRLDRRGFFYAPTVLSAVRPGMAAFDEETFGPVAAVVFARDVPEAIELANRTPFGLGASVWSRDAARAEALAPEIEAGSVFVNGIVKSDPRLPFGGVKQSGWGRELAAQGIREFVNVKTTWTGKFE